MILLSGLSSSLLHHFNPDMKCMIYTVLINILYTGHDMQTTMWCDAAETTGISDFGFLTSDSLITSSAPPALVVSTVTPVPGNRTVKGCVLRIYSLSIALFRFIPSYLFFCDLCVYTP